MEGGPLHLVRGTTRSRLRFHARTARPRGEGTTAVRRPCHRVVHPDFTLGRAVGSQATVNRGSGGRGSVRDPLPSGRPGGARSGWASPTRTRWGRGASGREVLLTRVAGGRAHGGGDSPYPDANGSRQGSALVVVVMVVAVVHHGRTGCLGGFGGRRLRQRPGRVPDRCLQDRADPTRWTLARRRARRDRDPELDRLVQPRASRRIDRRPHTAPGRRSSLRSTKPSHPSGVETHSGASGITGAVETAVMTSLAFDTTEHRAHDPVLPMS